MCGDGGLETHCRMAVERSLYTSASSEGTEGEEWGVEQWMWLLEVLCVWR